MRVRIHRGTEEIGGSCVEIEADNGARIVVDLGRPLWADHRQHVPLPEVQGLVDRDPSLLAVLISHPHLDHYGMLEQVISDVPVWIGREAAAILDAAAFFSPISTRIEPTGHLAHRTPIRIGPFTVTPYLADHSAFDAYSLLVQADDQSLFYSGDLRAHGRKARLFDELVTDPPADVDVLLLEGTHVRADATYDTATFPTEADLEQQLIDLCAATDGAVVLFGSGQNLDRIVTAHRAALRSDRQFVLDLYGASVGHATRPTMPQPGARGLRVYVPQRQRVRVKQSRQFHRVHDVTDCRVFPEEMAADPGRFLLHVPSSTAGELLRAGVLTPYGHAVWSLWHGYLEEPSGVRLQRQLASADVAMIHVHTSGHASVPDLQRLVEALSPARVVPIHSEAADRYEELFDRVDRRTDHEWWPVQDSVPQEVRAT